MFTPFAFVTSGVTAPAGNIPTGSLVAWYDASDYSSGATWTDRSVNGYDLTLSSTYSKVTSPITAVFFNGGYGTKSGVADWTSTDDITHVEIIRPTVVTNFVGSFVVQGTNQLGAFEFDGTGRIYTWRNGGTGYYVNGTGYATAKTSFVARRVTSGFDNTTGTSQGLVVSVADSSTLPLTHYSGSSLVLGRVNTTTYTIGASATLGVGLIDTTVPLSYDQPGYYGVNLFYNRILTDQEITDIYTYYKSTYSLI